MLSGSAIKAVAAVRMPDSSIRIGEPSEVKAFLALAKEHRFYTAYYLTLCLGLRFGELRGLKWGDIVKDQLHIQRTLSGDKAIPSFGPPKTKKGDRLLPIPKDVMALLEKHQETQAALREKMAGQWQDYDLIFTTKFGTSPCRARLVRPFEKLADKAEVPVIRFHDLRHTAASLWIASDMDVATVSARLGHADINLCPCF